MATIAYDFKVTEDGSIFIDPDKMDFVITPSDPEHIRKVMLGVPGWVKRAPLSGFNPYSRINSKTSKQANIQAATLALQNDGYVKGINGIDFELTPNGEFNVKILDVYRP